MWTIIGNIFVGLAVPLVKWFFEKKEKRKLNDKEFVDFILSHQKQKSRAGDVALDFKAARAKALKELEEEEKAKK